MYWPVFVGTANDLGRTRPDGPREPRLTPSDDPPGPWGAGAGPADLVGDGRVLRTELLLTSSTAGNDPKVVLALVGHTSIMITADTYTGVLPCLARQVVEATAALIPAAARDHANAALPNRKQCRKQGKRRSGRDRSRKSGRIRAHVGPIA